jgi:DNA replication initiation complex subunit (GINS family)
LQQVPGKSNAAAMPENAVKVEEEGHAANPPVEKSEDIVAAEREAEQSMVKADPSESAKDEKGTSNDHREDKDKKKRKYKIDEELLIAFRYFDRNCAPLKLSHSLFRRSL